MEKLVKKASAFSKIHLLMLLIALMYGCSASKKVVDTPPVVDPNPRMIKTTTKLMEVDILQNLYVVDNDNKLKVYGENNQVKAEYYSRKLGNIHSIDVTNPMKILVFYKEHSTIKVLDNTLNEIKTVAFNEKSGLNGVGPVAMANDGNYWVYNPTSQKLIKINDQLQTLAETNPLRDLQMLNALPKKIVETNNQVVMLDKNETFLLFDNFGQFLKKYDLSNITDFQFDGINILYQTRTGMKSQPLSATNFIMIGMPLSIQVTEAQHIKMMQKFWAVAYSNGIDKVAREK